MSVCAVHGGHDMPRLPTHVCDRVLGGCLCLVWTASQYLIVSMFWLWCDMCALYDVVLQTRTGCCVMTDSW